MCEHGRVVIACEPTLEGVLAAVGVAYLAHACPDTVRLERRDLCQPMLGEGVVEVDGTSDASVSLARRVYDGFEARAARDCGHAREGACNASCAHLCATRLVYACACDEAAMPERVHRYVRLGFAHGADVRGMLAHPVVSAFDALTTCVANECEHTRQFVRFSHMEDGSFFAAFCPNANTIPLTTSYFAARMRGERFCIADPAHAIAAFHEPGRRGCTVSRLDGPLMELLLERGQALADDERYVREMWRTFYASMALDGRDASQRGYDLRASWMPKRFWGRLTELCPDDEGQAAPVPTRYGGDASPVLPQG